MKFRSVLFAASALALVACSSTTSTGPTPAQVQAQIAAAAQDASLVASGLKAALPALAQSFKIDTVTLTNVTYAVADLQNLATQLSSAATTAQAQPVVAQIETDINAVVNAVASAQGLPPNVQKIVSAAAVVAPIIESTINAIAPSAVAPTTPAKVGAPLLSPDQALAILKAAPALVN